MIFLRIIKGTARRASTTNTEITSDLMKRSWAILVLASKYKFMLSIEQNTKEKPELIIDKQYVKIF